MLYSRLSILDNIIPPNKIRDLIDYFGSLTYNTYDRITVLKVVNELNIKPDIALKVLMKCVGLGILEISFGVRCCECGLLVKRFQKLEDVLENEKIYCYSCDENFRVEKENIEILYKLIDEDFFQLSQQKNEGKKKESFVAYENGIDFCLNSSDKSGNYLLYNPTPEEYGELKRQYIEIFNEDGTTKDKGDRLEDFIKYLFSLISGFKVGGINTTTNQMDCYIRNILGGKVPILELMGDRFLIECKNEKHVPKGEYLSKIHSIITTINGKKQLIKFGIIASKVKGPKTFQILSNKYYLINEIIIISLSGEELKEIVLNRANLLEMIDRKSEEIILDATSDLVKAGIFDC